MKSARLNFGIVFLCLLILSLVWIIPASAADAEYPYEIQTPILQHDNSEVFRLIDGAAVTGVSVKKLAADERTAWVYVALYSDGVMHKAALAQLDDAAWEVGTVKDIPVSLTLDADADIDDCELRVFAFSDSMVPLANYVSMSNYPLDNSAPTIWMAGDSLSAVYRDNQRPQTGWMEVFASDYAPNLTIQNKAVGGESSRTFYDGGNLTEILESAQSGDYLFVQFSHNDTHTDANHPNHYTEPGDWDETDPTVWVPSTYEEYMSKYITEARAKGVKPVLVTSVAWAQYDGNTFTGRTYRKLERYAEGARYLAELYHVPLVEVFEPTCEYHESTQSVAEHKYYYMYVDVCSATSADDCVNKVRHSDWDHSWCANFTEAKADNVHVNHKGAAWIAQIVADELFELDLPVTDLIKQQPADPANGASIVFGATAAEDEINCITYNEDYERTTYEGKTSVAIPDGGKMHFTLSDEVLGDATTAKLTIEYYYSPEVDPDIQNDKPDRPYIEYYTGSDVRHNDSVTTPTSSGWTTVEYLFENLPFTSSGYDFRINNTSYGVSGEPIYIANIKVEKVEVADPADGASIVFGATAAEDEINCITYSEDYERTTHAEKTSVVIPDGRSMHFTLNDAVLGDAAAAKLTIEYYYSTKVDPDVQSDKPDRPYIDYISDERHNDSVTTPTSEGWTTVEYLFKNLPFTSSGYDFRINNTSYGLSGEPIYVASIKVEKVKEADPTLGASVTFGATAIDDITNCMTYTADAECVSTTYQGKSCIRIPHRPSSGTGRNYLYFTLDDEVLGTGSNADVTITYYDAGVSPRLEYYNSSNEFKNPAFDTASYHGWKKVTLSLADLPVTDGSGWSGQFRIRSDSGDNPALDYIYIADIKVEAVAEETE